MQKMTNLAAIVSLAAGGVLAGAAAAQTQSISTDWTSGGTYISVNNSGTFFDITAMDPAGIRIQGFDVRSYGTAGTVFTGSVYYREGTYYGYNHNASVWTLLGSAQTASTGRNTPTPLPVGGLAIPSGATYGIYINHSNGGLMYKSASVMEPFYSNDHVRLELGAAQEGLFAGTLWWPRGVVVNVYYTVGTDPVEGACCLPSAMCEIRSEHLCDAAGGVYQGDGTDCTVGCVSGACCLRDGSCIIATATGCEGQQGIYQGDETLCANITCPPPGACCLPTGCVVVAEARCDELEGDYKGHGMPCNGAGCPPAQLSSFVIPRDLTELSVGGGGTGLSMTNPATLQFVIGASEFDRIPRGSELTGITWRVASAAGFNATWPSSNCNYGRFDIELATSVNPPGQMSNTFAENVGPDAVIVRHGPMTFPAMSFPGGASPPTPNAFGPVVEFTTPFVYQGGDVVMTIRRSAASAGYTTHDIVGTNHAYLGYGTLFQATQNSLDSEATTANAISPGAVFFIPQMTFIAPPCYADCDGNGALNVDDFICFINEFAVAQSLPPAQQINHYANCNGNTSEPVLTVDDFICFVDAFAAGCP
jgi:hypothetical protein